MARRFLCADLEIRPQERSIVRDGSPVAVGARAFDLLLMLIEHRERTVTKNELMDAVWPGVVVEENNLSVQVATLRKLLGTAAIATISGRGYRFAAPIEERDDTDVASAPPVAAPPAAEAASTSRAATVPPLTLPDRPSLAVMPFDNLSGDAQQDFFVDGITEDVITELARFRSLFVIARDSSFSYRGKSVDVRTVARELGVRYVLHGSFRRAGQQVRMVANLADAQTGSQLWAERFDRALSDIFALQEDLTRAIVAAIAPQVEAGEFNRLRSVQPADLTAYELALRARDLARQADTADDAPARQEALEMARRAMAIDPRCRAARSTIAFLCWQQIWAGSAADPAQVAAEGLAAARGAIAADAADHLAHLWKGMLMIYSGDHAAGLADLARAHELNPNDALVLSLLGQFLAAERDPAAGVAHAREALRLSPRDPLRWSYLNSLAWALFSARAEAEAADVARQALADAPGFAPAALCLTLCLAAQGDEAGARQAFLRLRGLAPALVATRLAGRWNYAQPAWVARATALLQSVAQSAG